ncbi:Uncharacterized protein FWK35_00005957 [Aphis craccivora]|uniref:Ig-like domain-containing protein n=1 Tax=Aphis craccivora TaxID=307492 RepID=A0A6G0ZCB2_APHCR|nr:Uncharacterized protein FWK35_00005957 [Aphis craccivora]
MLAIRNVSTWLARLKGKLRLSFYHLTYIAVVTLRYNHLTTFQIPVTLNFKVRGVPEPWVSWFKDGEPLLSSERHAVRRTNAGKCTLTIADVSDGDEGRYSCEAVNDQGRVCTLTVVQVIANRRIVEAERRLQGIFSIVRCPVEQYDRKTVYRVDIIVLITIRKFFILQTYHTANREISTLYLLVMLNGTANEIVFNGVTWNSKVYSGDESRSESATMNSTLHDKSIT